LVSYCKCGKHASFPECIELPNVGREGHTYLHHYLHGPKADVYMFVNGGLASKHESKLSEAFVIADTIVKRSRDLRYTDGSMTLMGDPAAEKRPVGSVERFMAEGPGSCETTSRGTCCRACPVTHCCMLFGMLCLGDSQYAFNAQRNCTWAGTTNENGGLKTLEPAEPDTFPAWLLQTFGIEWDTFERRQWAPLGTFAASRAALEGARDGLKRAVAALGRSETGGMTGHYLERAWRVIFTTKYL